MTELFHGTTVLRKDTILQDGLCGPTFLAEDRDLALRYAKARCAAAVEARQDGRALLLTVSVDDARPDPTFECKSGQWVVDDGVRPESIIKTEIVDLGWSWWKPSADRMLALLNWGNLQRVREEGYSDGPPTSAGLSPERQAVLALRAGLIDP